MSIDKIDLGLCCINMTLREQKPTVFVNRTCRLKTAEEKGIEYVQELAEKNLDDVFTLLKWNKKNGIKAYRLSSDMFPHAGNPRYGEERKKGPRYSLKFAKKKLNKIGLKAKKYGIRLSFHPGQYNQVASPTENVFKNTILDLSHHARILDLIERNIDVGENKGIICIHGGGVYGDKKKTMKRWIERFKLLPKNVQDRVALENCEKCYSTEDCLQICQKLNIPLIFDIHHYACYSKLHPQEKQKKIKDLLPQILETWNKRGLKPFFHISEQGSGKTGHHSDYIESIPDYMFEIGPVTLDVEAKCKEKAILKLIKKYKKQKEVSFNPSNI